MQNRLVNRYAALASGALIDVSDMAEELGISYPVAFSTALYHGRELHNERRLKNVAMLIRMALGSDKWRFGENTGEFTFATLVDHGDSDCSIFLRVVVERLPGAGVVATLLNDHERLNLEHGEVATFYEN